MLSATGSPQLRAAVLALKSANRDLRRDVYARMRSEMNPVWRRAVAENLSWNMEGRMLDVGVRIAAGNPPTLIAASSKRGIGRTKSLIPAEHWQAFEYGASQAKVKTYTRRNRKGGGTHKVTRHTTRQLKPRSKTGHVLGPAVAQTAPRLVSLAVQSIVRTYMEILDPKG